MKKIFHKKPKKDIDPHRKTPGWKMTRRERRLTKKKYGRKLKNDQLLKTTAVTVMHGTCMSISIYASV